MRVIGIDPGLSGAVVAVDDNMKPWVFDTPTFEVTRNKAKRRKYDFAEMLKILRMFVAGHTDVRAAIEFQQAMPSSLQGRAQGTASSFATGYGYGAWCMALAAVEIPFEEIHPATWKAKLLGGAKGDKGAAIIRAKQLFPLAADDLQRVKDHGRAEAMLIAEYARRHVWAAAVTA